MSDPKVEREKWCVRGLAARVRRHWPRDRASYYLVQTFHLNKLCLVAFFENKISNKKPDTYSVSGETEFLGGEPTKREGECTIPIHNSQFKIHNY